MKFYWVDTDDMWRVADLPDDAPEHMQIAVSYRCPLCGGETSIRLISYDNPVIGPPRTFSHDDVVHPLPERWMRPSADGQSQEIMRIAEGRAQRERVVPGVVLEKWTPGQVPQWQAGATP